MNQNKRITQLANELIKRFNFGWLQRQLNLRSVQLRRRLSDHDWTIDESTVINNYHENPNL